MKIRVGFGYDVHAFVADRELWLGGIRIEHSMGLQGHSDADVLIHAICDALLGAANMRDIGYHFPDTAEEYEGIEFRFPESGLCVRCGSHGDGRGDVGFPGDADILRWEGTESVHCRRAGGQRGVARRPDWRGRRDAAGQAEGERGKHQPDPPGSRQGRAHRNPGEQPGPELHLALRRHQPDAHRGDHRRHL